MTFENLLNISNHSASECAKEWTLCLSENITLLRVHLTDTCKTTHSSCIARKTLQIYYHFQTRIPLVPESKPSKSPALIPIFLPKTSIRRIALLLLLPLGANLFLQRWKLSVPTKLLTHSQWRCQFSRPRHCGLDNLIGEARRCVPGRAIQMLYYCLSQCWLLSCCADSRFSPPPPPPPPPRFFPPLPRARMGDTQHRHRPLRESFVGEGGHSLVAS